MIKPLYRLTLTALVVTAVVIMLGAYTRLTDAGLGCPDWPGCYGFLTVPTQAEHVAQAELAFPERPVEAHKAWNEMIHRYFAGSLGLLILGIFLLSMKAKQAMGLPTVLLVTVCFQAVLGMWTVTMNLQPLVVMGHLLGGFTTFSLLLLMALRLRRQLKPSWIPSLSVVVDKPMLRLLKLSVVVLVLQIALGGWTASNYAAVACIQLPVCEDGWQQKFNLAQALTVPTGHADYEYGVFPFEARMTIHILHRMGAAVTTLVLMLLLWRLWRTGQSGNQQMAMGVGLLLIAQVGLGISNVMLQIPLAIAVAHNFVAAGLLLSLLACTYLCWHKGQIQIPRSELASFTKAASQGV